MSDEDRIKERNRERLTDDEMMNHMLFMAAAMAGGAKASDADKQAAAAVNILRSKFT